MRLSRVYLRSLNILWAEERNLTIALVTASTMVGVIQAIEPVIFGKAIDALAKGASVVSIVVFWSLLGIANIFTSVFLAVMSDRLAHRQRLNTLGQVFERVIALPVSYHSELGSGRVVHAILSGTDRLFDLWLSFLREHLSSMIGIALLLPLAITMDWRMTTLLFLLSSIYGVANYKILSKTYYKQELVEMHRQNLFARIGDVIGNVTIVQSYSRLWDEIQSLQRIAAQLLHDQYPILTWWGLLAVITRISSTLTMVAILILGAWLVHLHQLTVGDVVTFVSFSGLLIGKMEQISGFVSRAIAQTPQLQNFFELLDRDGIAIDLPNAKPIDQIQGEVTFNHVFYHYPNSPMGVFNVNFHVKAGQTAALVGPSGSGKTTTLALLQRLFDPQSGTIMIDGEDIRNFTVTSLRHSIATVFQDSGLFNRSISENIRIGRPSSTDEEVQEAARRADAHHFILNKPGGYDFIIGERGSALSGGERQRIAIARAILKNAAILIFDEATSALDNQTERRIQNALANLRSENKTTFIIAHRLSTVVSADLILVFDKGNIVEHGTFQSLRGQDGLFSQLVRLGEITPEKVIGGIDAN